MNILYYVPNHMDSEKAGSFVRGRKKRLGLEIEFYRVEQTDTEQVKKEKNIPDFPCLVIDEWGRDERRYVRFKEIIRCPLLAINVEVKDDPNKKYFFKQGLDSKI